MFDVGDTVLAGDSQRGLAPREGKIVELDPNQELGEYKVSFDALGQDYNWFKADQLTLVKDEA